MLYKGKKLDTFQLEAIKYVDKNENVIIAAPTGTGKTLIADYCIEKCLKEGKSVVYTAPIKALSNQKYREFSEVFGKDKVGVLTGDTVINKTAPLLIMTTEIYRNILYSDIDLGRDISCVIFDEIHYISDEDRGTVWEESILMKPKETFMVGLSATIPNINDLADWVMTVKNEKVNVVTHKERAVPLAHKFFCNGTIVGFDEVDSLSKFSDLKNDEYDYLNLLNTFNISDFPILYFSFNRRGCYDKALAYGKNIALRGDSVRREIDSVIKKVLRNYEWDEDKIVAFKMYKTLFYKGIGIHHAGIIPIVKLIVEELLENRLLNIIFCTETFAIGINFPVKTVCIDGYRKFDGYEFRNLYNKEYFQIGGRAGRRGIDEFGNVITLIRPSDLRFGDFPVWSEGGMELLKSNFRLSYNATMQMFLDPDKKIESLLKDNFALFLMGKQREFFREAKENFFKEISQIKTECCDNMGKNCCPIHHNYILNDMDKQLQNIKANGEKNKKIKEIKAFRMKKVQNCVKEQRRYCKSRYGEYMNLVDIYLKEKQLHEAYCERFTEDYFQKQYEIKKKLLDKMGYINTVQNKSLVRGETMKNIYIQELLLCELVYSDFFEKYSEEVICGIISGIDYDGGKVPKENTVREQMVDAYLEMVRFSDNLIEIEKKELGYSDIKFMPTPLNIAYDIACGGKISDIMITSDLSDGDIVSIARRTIAILSEIKEAVSDRPYLVNKLKSCISRIDRDEYKALL